MQAVLDRMNLHGRVVLCGLISGYTREDPAMAKLRPGPHEAPSRRRLHHSRLRFTLHGRRQATRHVEDDGQAQGPSDHRQRPGKSPEAINMLFEGKNIGKLIVEL